MSEAIIRFGQSAAVQSVRDALFRPVRAAAFGATAAIGIVGILGLSYAIAEGGRSRI